MKKVISLLLAAVLLLSLAACGGDATTPAETTAPTETTEVTEATAATQPTYTESENPVAFFSLSLGENYENIRSITVFDNGDGTVHVEYVGDVKKVAEMDPSIFHGITAALEASGLVELNGQDVWGDGEANGSMYIDFADGTCLTAGFSGEIPEAYTAGYAAMDAYFAELTADIAEYVPQPMVMGDVDAALLEEMTAILSGSGIANLDAFTISQVAKDESFTFMMGLSSDEGIATGVTCAPMMMTSAYSLAIVTLEEGTDAQAVCADFEACLDWAKWVCVAPSHAMIATKGNMVLCLMGSNETFIGTAEGITAAGWTVETTLENPMG